MLKVVNEKQNGGPLKSSVAEPHHFYAAPAPCKNFDAAPAPTLVYSKPISENKQKFT
jgi:hypothetical protein